MLDNQLALQQSTLDTSGPGSFSFGTLSAATFGGLQGSGNLTLPSSFALTVGGNGFTTIFSGSFCGDGSVTVTVIGPGGLVLTGDNSGFPGVVSVVSGMLEAADFTALPAYLADGASGAVQSGATLAVGVAAGQWQSSQIDTLLSSGVFASGSNFGVDVGSETCSLANTVADTEAGPLGFVVLGYGGTLVFTGTGNSYSGGTWIIGCTVQAASTSYFGTGAAPVTLEDGTIQATGPLNLATSIVLGPGGGEVDVNGNLVQEVSLSGSDLVIADTAGNGTLELGANSTVDSLTMEGGALDLYGYTLERRLDWRFQFYDHR